MALNQPSRLYINSEDRIFGTTHQNFTITLAQPILNAVSAEVTTITVPFLCPPIPPYENYLYFNIFDSATLAVKHYQITFDTTINYSLTTLVSTLNTFMLNAFCLDTGLLENISFVVWSLRTSTQSNSNKIFFDCASDPTKSLQFVGYGFYPGSPNYNNLSYRLGFPQVSNDDFPVAGNFYVDAFSYESAGNVWAYPSLLRTSNVYLRSSLATGDNITTRDQYNMLFKLPVPNNQSFGETLALNSFNLPNEFTLKRIPKYINTISIELLDDNFQPFNIPNDGPGIVAIEILFRYDTNDSRI